MNVFPLFFPHIKGKPGTSYMSNACGNGQIHHCVYVLKKKTGKTFNQVSKVAVFLWVWREPRLMYLYFVQIIMYFPPQISFLKFRKDNIQYGPPLKRNYKIITYSLPVAFKLCYTLESRGKLFNLFPVCPENTHWRRLCLQHLPLGNLQITVLTLPLNLP